MASSTAKTMQAFHAGSILNLLPVLLLISFGFVLGKVGNANFSPESYLPTIRAVSPTPPKTKCVRPPMKLLPGHMEFEDFLAPSGGGLVHNMTDEELLWRASMEPRRTPHVSIVPKVAFLLLSLELSFMNHSVGATAFILVMQWLSMNLFLFYWHDYEVLINKISLRQKGCLPLPDAGAAAAVATVGGIFQWTRPRALLHLCAR
jgi:hypothetical protein